MSSLFGNGRIKAYTDFLAPGRMTLSQSQAGIHFIFERLPMNTDSSPVPAVSAAQSVQPAEAYAGDISAPLAWQWVQSGAAALIDVRTDAEREWVGFVPGATAVAWAQWPGMVPNLDFNASLKAAVSEGKKALFLCRSGVRSVAAAKRATELGFESYNIVGGFEGDADAQAQRGNLGGWRLQGLPWMQK